MNKVCILDCTLRDGGYINEWQFGATNIRKIIAKLVEANIDIIECGFLTEKKQKDDECSLFNTVDKVRGFLPGDRKNSLMVCMVNYGEYNITDIPPYDGTSVDGIRIAFHKKDLEGAMRFCESVQKKGYKVFVQPMVSISYTDEEFINLIKITNLIKPHAFYIVDSFGVMKRKDLLRLYYLVDHNLDKDIYVGYHSHNNIQMAFSNAQALVDLKTKREIIIDSSVFGMGRGAGNLNTELFIEYLNEINGENYKPKPLLQIIDQILAPVYLNTYWGYSLPHYASAIHNCHPNYASYLDDKNTLTIENINEILSSMSDDKKINFDKEYIESLYNQYQTRLIEDEHARKELTKVFSGKTALIIAPGSSINTEADKISSCMLEPDTISVSINFKPEKFSCDYIFVSNLRRYADLRNKEYLRLIATSNIKNGSFNGYVVNYSDLLNHIEAVEDNSAMMLIKLLIGLNVKEIKLAGLDGYSHDVYDNFAKRDMAFLKSGSVMDAMNIGMEKMLAEFSKTVDIEFITTPKYVKLGAEQSESSNIWRDIAKISPSRILKAVSE